MDKMLSRRRFLRTIAMASVAGTAILTNVAEGDLAAQAYAETRNNVRDLEHWLLETGKSHVDQNTYNAAISAI